ncbi:MAG: CCA tRNA nucleotidyltransferase, partial [Alphaproteobacteria bacterium]|nr:CCA tRNA nucleotidyltransferase [Alphaproteobacteria bacterium]
ADGTVFDSVGGVDDLKAGRVRFVGDATTRIREDYLRILRLFRFHAWYGKGEMDGEALRAAAAEKAGLAKLSGERVQKELLKLLEAEDPAPVLRIMAASGILSEILPGALNIPRLEHLARIDAEALTFVADPLLRLAALLPDDASVADATVKRLRLSNAQADRLRAIVDAKDAKIVSYMSVKEMNRRLYRLGTPLFCDLLFLRWANDPKESNGVNWRALLEQARTWPRPLFPLNGRHVMLAGIPEGPLVGEILKEVEDWWVDADFIDDEFSIAERLKAIVNGRRPD